MVIVKTSANTGTREYSVEELMMVVDDYSGRTGAHSFAKWNADYARAFLDMPQILKLCDKEGESVALMILMYHPDLFDECKKKYSKHPEILGIVGKSKISIGEYIAREEYKRLPELKSGKRS